MRIEDYSEEIQNLINGIIESRGVDPKSTIELCEKLEMIGQSKKDDSLLGFAYFSLGETYYLLNDASNFYTKMLACLGPLEYTKEWEYVAMANNLLGIMSLNRGNAPFALDYYIKAISICHDYNLPEIEWIIHLNLGSLYLSIEEFQKSLNHSEKAYQYLLEEKETENYISNITDVSLVMARAYLKLENVEKAIELVKETKDSYSSHFDEMQKLVWYCFYAELHHQVREYEARDYWINKVNELANSKMPVMDVFDEFYDYMDMLLQIEKYDDFFRIYSLMDELTKQTTIKNLEKKLLTLKIRYYRRTGKIEEYKRSAVLYFELSEYMERENRQMVSNMLVMRNSYSELAEINKRVEKENNYLHMQSETDALTGLYNRYKLNEYSEQAFTKCLKENKYFAVEILDIDYFKQYNDNYGHQSGDECIKFLANILMQMAKREGVFTARYGGDEFVVIYEGYNEEKIAQQAERLKQAVLDGRFEHKFSLAANVVTITQGICMGVPQEGQSVFGYLQGADKMLYEVKQSTKNDYKLCTYKEG